MSLSSNFQMQPGLLRSGSMQRVNGASSMRQVLCGGQMNFFGQQQQLGNGIKVTMFAYSLAKHQKISTLEPKDLLRHLEATEMEKKAYIVYMGERLKMEPLLIQSHHKSMLNQVITSNDASERLIHSYGRSFNAFAAMLTEDEAENLSSMEEVVSVFPSQQRQLQTTRSWDFIGFPPSTAHVAFESDVIVGMLDTGIWPESASFDDTGFDPPPHKWKGICQASNKNFACNNKIIGARCYYNGVSIRGGEGILSPRDFEGHGTHTASTVAGRLVTNASFSSLGESTIRGGVPSARLAVYKVCRSDVCLDTDILAAFDDAVEDGVDIISISIACDSPYTKYFSDAIAIGSFHAMRNGILVSCAAGNTGPDRYSVVNTPPWILTVAASSTIDCHAPYVASFSSRGPNRITSNLLKPDLTAPGVDILAAWSPVASKESTLYNIVSGTSMACAHISGLAAYVKSFNPSWSLAAIKSALMTTAFVMSPEKNPEAEFAYGAGHVNPIRALKPGLVYDADETDYINFLCGEGYTIENLRKVTKDLSRCTSETIGSTFDLNYPTFALKITKGKSFSATFHRIVTNVGDSNSIYKVNVIAPSGLKITIDPQILSFQSLLEKKSFEVKLEGETNETLLSASLVWSDGVHTVRSPMVVYAA